MTRNMPNTREKQQRLVAKEKLNTRLVGLPPVGRYTLKATSAYNLSTAGTRITHAVGCNTPFQPFRTVTTTVVPQYLTYLAQAWDRVYVRESRIKVEIVNTTVADSIFVVLSMDGNTSVATDINALADLRFSKSDTLGYFTGGNTKTVFTGVFKPQTHLGIPANSAENVCLGGDPSDPYFWAITEEPSAATVGNLAYRVSVEYDLVFSELKSPAP